MCLFAVLDPNFGQMFMDKKCCNIQRNLRLFLLFSLFWGPCTRVLLFRRPTSISIFKKSINLGRIDSSEQRISRASRAGVAACIRLEGKFQFRLPQSILDWCLELRLYARYTPGYTDNICRCRRRSHGRHP